MSLRLPRLGTDPDAPFPPAESALREPDGLLAMGGDLSPARLLNAYAHGIFPWFSAGQPILWWSPDPRAVFRTDGVRLSSRFRRILRGSRWDVVADTAFDQVVEACATIPRRGQGGTWITPGMRAAQRWNTGLLTRWSRAASIRSRRVSPPAGAVVDRAVGRCSTAVPASVMTRRLSARLGPASPVGAAASRWEVAGHPGRPRWRQHTDGPRDRQL